MSNSSLSTIASHLGLREIFASPKGLSARDPSAAAVCMFCFSCEGGHRRQSLTRQIDFSLGVPYCPLRDTPPSHIIDPLSLSLSLSVLSSSSEETYKGNGSECREEGTRTSRSRSRSSGERERRTSRRMVNKTKESVKADMARARKEEAMQRKVEQQEKMVWHHDDEAGGVDWVIAGRARLFGLERPPT